MGEKCWKIYAYFFFIYMIQNTFIPAIQLHNLDKWTNNRIADEAFNIRRDWFVFKINKCLWKKKNKGRYAKFDFRFFFQSALKWPILIITPLKKKKNLSKCVYLVQNLTHFEIFWKSYCAGCRITSVVK